MRKTLVITDLTQMPDADRVCIVGIDESGQTIRPVLPGPELLKGVLKRHLYIRGQLAIRPRARVRLHSHRVSIVRPHIEDLGFDPGTIAYLDLCSDVEWEQMLRDSSFRTVAEIYGGLLQEHRWVEPGANTRSIGTLSQAHAVTIQPREWVGRLRYRLCFRDTAGHLFDVPISDLAFREFTYAEVRKRNRPATDVARETTNLIASADRLYLRVGLARPWTNPNTGKRGCWPQITGIYTFPDYLQGKSFADF